MILYIISIVLGLLVVILGFTTFNLLRKQEKLEDIIVNQDNYIRNFDEQIGYAERRLNEIDLKGTFKGDDEIGWFFSQIKVIQESISRFKTDNINNGTN
jgi:HAMP domain-containing protein